MGIVRVIVVVVVVVVVVVLVILVVVGIVVSTVFVNSLNRCMCSTKRCCNSIDVFHIRLFKIGRASCRERV